MSYKFIHNVEYMSKISKNIPYASFYSSISFQSCCMKQSIPVSKKSFNTSLTTKYFTCKTC